MDTRSLTMWLEGVGWVTTQRPEDVADPDAGPNVPAIPGAQRACVSGVWTYVIPPANLVQLMQSAAASAQTQETPAQSAQSPNAAQTVPGATSVSFNPMQMMQQAMMMQLLKGMGIGQAEEQRPPLDLRQLTEPLSIFGDKLKEGIIGAVSIWKGLKGV